jgi:hypothetical protein
LKRYGFVRIPHFNPAVLAAFFIGTVILIIVIVIVVIFDIVVFVIKRGQVCSTFLQFRQ